MNKTSTKELIVCTYGKYTLFRRRDVYYADARSGTFRAAGKVSLGTKDREEAVQRLHHLDRNLAVRFGLLTAPAVALDTAAAKQLLIADGWDRYMEYCARPAALGGVSDGTRKRYQAVRDKHETFLKLQQTAMWQQVDDRQVLAYAKYLTDLGYSDNTLVLEINVVKGVIKWLIGENVLPPTARIRHTTRRNEDSTRYCFTRDQVNAILERCRADPALHWLHDVILFLTLTGARVGELKQLAWSAVDLDAQIITFVDNRSSALAKKVGAVRTTKGKRGRRVPIHPLLEIMLRRRHADRIDDTRVLRGPRGGELNPDHVRVALLRDVIGPLKTRFPTPAGEIGFEHGTTHSLRHVFVSQAFLAGANESEIGDWVGHKSSRVTRRYRHLGQQDSIRRMRQLDLLGPTSSTPANGSISSETQN